MKLPSLHMTASAASRDVTILHAMAFLHQANYDIGQATKYLVPPPNKQCYPFDVDKSTSHNTASLGGPILCRFMENYCMNLIYILNFQRPVRRMVSCRSHPF
jgi:hypothetical protein